MTITIFRVDPSNGRLTPTSHTLQVATPVCVVFVPIDRRFAAEVELRQRFARGGAIGQHHAPGRD